MTTMIDQTARIHPSAKIANDVFIGPWACIGEQVEIGAGTKIESHAVIMKHTKMGKNNHVHSHAVVGGDPQDLSYRGEETWLEIGDENIIREFVTLNRGSMRGEKITRIGNKNCFLTYSHVGHDACIGNEVLFINNASIGGHVTVDDYAIIGAYSAVHQFCRIGAYSFLAHATQVTYDIPPFVLVKGSPGAPVALNLVGLRRRGISSEAVSAIKKAFRIMYRQNLPLKTVEIELTELAKTIPEIALILDVIRNSKRGVVRKQANLVAV